MKGFAHHLAYDFKAGIKDKTLMLMNYLFPLGFFLLVSLFMSKINPFFNEIMIPGMILFAIMSSTLLSLPGTIISNREAGIFRSFRVNGVPSYALIIIPILGCLFHTALASGLITLGGIFLYDGKAPLNWGWFLALFLITSLTLSSLGVLIGIVAQSSRAGILIAQAFYLPSVLLGGLMVPEAAIPEDLRAVASLLPATHSIRAFNIFAMADAPISGTLAVPLIVLLTSTLINILLAFLLFQWDTKPTYKGRNLLALLAFCPYIISIFF